MLSCACVWSTIARVFRIWSPVVADHSCATPAVQAHEEMQEAMQVKAEQTKVRYELCSWQYAVFYCILIQPFLRARLHFVHTHTHMERPEI